MSENTGTKSIMWTLNQALNFIRELQPRAQEAGFCILLGGGVLNNGYSREDLDILAYPCGLHPKREDMLALLPSDIVQLSSTPKADIYRFEIEVPGWTGKRPVEIIFQISGA